MKDKLNKKAFELRQKILNIVIKRGGHLATSFSCLDIVVALFYGGILKFKSYNSSWEGRDRFILSKGHAETLIYAILEDLKFFPKSFFFNHYRYGKFLLGGHTDCNVPGIEFSAGALGHGLSLACGTALALKRKKSKSKVFVLMSDGECSEGSVWEAGIFASQHKLDNLVAIIDNNRISATDFLDNFTSLNNLSKKFKSFGWNSININGHNIIEMQKIFLKVKKNNSGKPFIFVANTIKGKGIKFIENDPSRHTKGLSKQEEIEAMKILKII
jgi:transketolase